MKCTCNKRGVRQSDLPQTAGSAFCIYVGTQKISTQSSKLMVSRRSLLSIWGKRYTTPTLYSIPDTSHIFFYNKKSKLWNTMHR